MQRFTTRIHVRSYEIDTLGHVNNAVYQHYLEHAAVEHSAHLGYTFERYREIGGVFVLRKIEIEYRRAAVAGDTLDVTTWIHEMRGVRAIRRYEIQRVSDGELIVMAEALWAYVDLATMRPRAIPQILLDDFTAQQTA